MADTIAKIYLSDDVLASLLILLSSIFSLWVAEKFFSVKIFLYSSKDIKVVFCVILFLISLLTLLGPFCFFVLPEIGLVFDRWAVISRFVIFASMLTVVIGLDNSKRSWEQVTGSSPLVELFLLVSLLFGAIVLVSCVNLILLIVFFEIISLLMFILGLKASAKVMTTSEAFVKYILSSGVSSAVVYLGIYFILCGSFLAVGIHVWKDGLAFMHVDLNNSEFWSLLRGDLSQESNVFIPSILLKMLGVLLVVCGFAFKFGLAPFHFWMADLYQGLSGFALGLFMSIPKLALFLTLIRFTSLYTLQSVFMHLGLHYLFTGLGVLSIVLGAVGMLKQYNVKRLLAFSSIHNFGYIFLGLGTNSSYGLVGALNFFYAYIVVVISFLIIIGLTRRFLGEHDMIFNLEILIPSLWKVNKPLSFILFMLLFTFLGMPPAFTFFLKTHVIYSVLESGTTSGFLISWTVLLFSSFSIWVYVHLVTECLFYYSGRLVDIPFVERFGSEWPGFLVLVGTIMVGFYFSFVWCFSGYGFIIDWILRHIFS